MSSSYIVILKDYLDIVNNLIVALGAIVAIVLYAKHQFERSYEQLNDRYLDFLQLQLNYPGLGTNTTDTIEIVFEENSKESAAQDLLFDYLLSILERAFMFLNTGLDRHFPWKSKEWVTWDEWVDEYAKNKNFLHFWSKISENSCYTQRFVDYLNTKLSKIND